MWYNIENSTMNGELIMPVSYDKLWKILIDKRMNRTELKDMAGISFNVLAKMGRNEYVSMDSLEKYAVLLIVILATSLIL